MLIVDPYNNEFALCIEANEITILYYFRLYSRGLKLDIRFLWTCHQDIQVKRLNVVDRTLCQEKSKNKWKNENETRWIESSLQTSSVLDQRKPMILYMYLLVALFQLSKPVQTNLLYHLLPMTPMAKQKANLYYMFAWGHTALTSRWTLTGICLGNSWAFLKYIFRHHVELWLEYA
jgi:hypothetical protein